jgi:hypothetical protein
MSYDYNALVASIAAHRRKALEKNDDKESHLQQAVDTFATLSSHCPMTPLLWMQYAHDTAKLLALLIPEEPQQASDMRLQTLELGLAEFPGCALLRLHYLELLMETNKAEKLDTAFRQAMKSVGRGSHQNEGHFVAAIYRLYAKFLVSREKSVIDVFVERAKTPMKEANDGLVSEAQEFCQSHDIILTQGDLQRIEDARRWATKTFGSLAVNEDDVDVAMHAEGILTRHEYSHQDMDWDALLKSEGGRLWMGFGGVQTATAFIKYANACSYYKVPRHEMEQDREESKQKLEIIHSLAMAVFERGVAECPTVESLWLAYIHQLAYLISIKSPLVSVPQFESVVNRAARNCPYSVRLIEQQINAALILAEAGQSVFDPDSLTTIVDNAIKSKFLPDPASQLELYMAVVRTVRRRILSVLAQAGDKGGKYDDAAEQNGKKKKGKSSDDHPEEAVIGDAAEQEVQDLVEDLRDLYDSADAFMRKNHTSFTEGRAILWKDRAMTETYLLSPLIESVEGAEEKGSGEGLRCFDKLVKVHQPPHPHSHSLHIREFMKQPVSSPVQVVRKLQAARCLFQMALKSVGKMKDVPESIGSQRDRAIALQDLCHDYLEFEKVFGSEDSYTQAAKSVRRKFESVVTNGNQAENSTLHGEKAVVAVGDTSAGSKRARPEDDSTEAAAKKLKPAIPGASDGDIDMGDALSASKSVEETAVPANDFEKPKKPPVYKVRVGKMDYPAHPFTVRVTNLAGETEDMDLVDLFRAKCGPVVHAKIVREKSHHPGKHKSKGWGLVQFEDRDSVEKALTLNDLIGIHERLINVDRSHVPAVGLVPPGMHRVKPKGEGKSSKRNQKKREGKLSKDETHEDVTMKDENAKDDESKREVPGKAAATDSASILSFRPRGVARRKPKISLESKKPMDKSNS